MFVTTLGWTTLMHQNECTFPKIRSLSTGGAHSRVEASITSPTSPPYVAKQLTVLFHTQLLCSFLVFFFFFFFLHQKSFYIYNTRKDLLGLRIYIYIKQERKKLQKQYSLLGQVKTVQQVDVRLASTLTRSTGGALTGKPECERAPRMHLIEDLKSEKVRRHLSQAIVELYELSHFEARSDASLL